MTGLLFCALALAVGSLCYGVWCRRREKRTLQSLDQMLDRALRGAFREEDYDESLLSAVETRLARYLSDAEVSAQNLRQEKDRIKTLIGDISHQTKTPVANLLLYTQLLGEQELPEESGKLVAALEGQTEKLKVLMEALVKTSRLEAGILAFHPAPNPIEPLLEEAVAQVRPRAVEKGITLRLEPTEERAKFDPKWTVEAVYNLLDNAVKYTSPGGAVSVTVTSYELFRRIDVTDTGIGIPEAEQAAVFGRFYRGREVYDTEGVGIGLYLVRQIAAGQGGYVKVTSRPGTGSVFSLFLPAE